MPTPMPTQPNLNFCPLSYLTAITFTSTSTSNSNSNSKDPTAIQNFLQGQLTCDLREVSETQSRPFAHCNLQGRMTTLGRIIQNQGFYYLIIPKSLAEETVKNLKKYAQFSRIQVQESPGLFFYGLASPTPESFWPKQLNHVAHFSLAGFPLSLCLEEQNSQHTRILCITDQPLDPKITFKDFTLKPEAWWLAQEIQNLTPYLTAETSGKFLPHEINLPNQQGVSFTKGCFLGQEIIARMEHLGKLKKQMACEVIESTEISGSSETKESSENLNEIICQCVYENKTYRLRLLKII